MAAYTLKIGDVLKFTQMPTNTRGLYLNNYTLDSKTYTVYLHGVRFNRNIYQPGEIDAEVSFTKVEGVSVLPTIEEATKYLLSKLVELAIDGETIAKNYYVNEIFPQKKPTDTNNLFIRLSIFSMDKLMTIDKYSKAYVVKKLGSGILESESKIFKLGNKTITTNTDSMQMLKYMQTRTVKKDEINKLTDDVLVQFSSEYIQPYLVQYNESFYDFLARTANRCGEFLFFEDGNLTLGLPDSGVLTEIKGYSTITYQGLCANPLDVKGFARDSMKDDEGEMTHTNYDTVPKSVAGYPRDAFPTDPVYNNELSSDEYFFPLFADKFTCMERELGWTDNDAEISTSVIFKALSSAITYTGDPVKSLSDFGFLVAQTGIQSGIRVIKANRDGKDKYINATDDSNKAKKLESSDGETRAVPFASNSTEGWTTLRYYQDVKQYEEQQQKKIICIDMGTSLDYKKLKLGSKIKLEKNGDTYVVIQILMTDDKTWSRTYTKYQDATHTKSENMQSQLIYAIPLAKVPDKDNPASQIEKAYPPVHTAPVFRKSEPQTAFITDNNDPKKQGRVRIVYPWQTDSQKKMEELKKAETDYAEAEQKVKDAEKLMKEYEEKKKKLDKKKEEFESTDKDRIISKKAKEINKIVERIEAIDETDGEIGILKKANNKLNNNDSTEIKEKGIQQLEADINTLNQGTDTDRYSKITDLKKEIQDRQEKIDTNNVKIKNLEDEKLQLKRSKIELEKEVVELTKSKTDDSYLKKVKSDINTLEKDYKEAKDNYSDYKKKRNAAKDYLEYLEGKFQSMIKGMSSPWIRVSTPMATPGGGVFFKPRVGDEVLINYDNGNIERPYVVGSLFSKNVLEPGEAMDRQSAMPQLADSSISIISPNGHGITFKDPKDGRKFAAGFVPVLDFATKFIPDKIPGLNKDLAGGIHIGDRYGMYAIDMSSDSRQVSISSPWGTVNMNAFTGITLSAPNGDVKIEGKNVTIKAGNNLSLSSGNNIMKEKSVKELMSKKLEEDAASLIWKGGNTFGMPWATLADGVSLDKIDLEKMFDISMARAMLEVFLRPVEGTLCIKSKRYLKLEAGKGEAKPPINRYKTDRVYDAEHEHVFFYSIKQGIQEINDCVNQFISHYSSKWQSAFGYKRAYNTYAVVYIDENEPQNNVPDVIKTVYDNRAHNKFKFEKEFDKISGLSDPDKQTLLNTANSFHKHVLAIVNYTRSFKTLFDSYNPAKYKHYDDKTKDILKAAASSFYDDDLKEELDKKYNKDTFAGTNTPDVNDSFFDGTYLKRRLIAKYIMEMFQLKYPLISNHDIKKFYLKYDDSTLTKDFLTDDTNWTKLVKDIGELNQAIKIVNDLTIGAIKKGIGVDEWKKMFRERGVWDDQKPGSILFSDQESKTAFFDDNGQGSLKYEDNDRWSLKRLKDFMTNM